MRGGGEEEGGEGEGERERGNEWINVSCAGIMQPMHAYIT